MFFVYTVTHFEIDVLNINIIREAMIAHEISLISLLN